ncbi:hypothetical protein EXS66_02510 [Candidatus Saccharibacteria bacterium]|nr:hypothetical protein [Candidatus Saccharibacteria bacterium]
MDAAEDKSQESAKKPAVKGKKGKGSVVAIIVLIVALVGGVGATWYFMNSKANAQKKQQDSKIEELQQQIDKLKEEASKATVVVVDPLSTQLTAAQTKAQIIKDVPAKNYSGLSDYMADSVKVVMAASEYQTTVTKAQAITDMKYLNGGTSPWDFNPAADEIHSYKTGSYKTYLASASIFGTASNMYFVAFTLDAGNKISQVFMAVNVGLVIVP